MREDKKTGRALHPVRKRRGNTAAFENSLRISSTYFENLPNILRIV